MLRDAHCLAQGVALQVEEDQPGAGGERLEHCRLLEALGGSQGKLGRFLQIDLPPGA